MKRWKTTQQMANDIAEIDICKETRELNISQCNLIAKNVKNLYNKGGKDDVINHLPATLPSWSSHSPNGFTMEQKVNAMEAVRELFRYHWFPISRIRNNMRRLTK